jgi:hypothetical protein
VIVNPQGRLNLQDLVKPSPDSAASAASASVASASASERTPEHAGATVPPLDPIITVGPISVVNGRVPFSDRFIQPNYSADLSELTGKLGGFSSQAQGDSVQLADLDLKGRAEGSATLEITGRLNPLAHPLALNIQGKVRDLELPPLSPYAIKYAGYGIERGKLNVEVRYEVQPNGQLTASNKIVLHQLSFGDKVEGAPNSLPVKLAALLLADRNGVIDLDLPISGSLNDPQFSIGPVVWKVFTNLIAKALTSPFSLLANAFGGSDALSVVPFPAGSAVLTQESRKGLDQVASALRDKPALTMTVVGAAGPQAERDGLKRERLNAWVLAEKRRRTAVSGQDTSDVSSVTAQEYPVLLKEVYKRADMVKPRNVVGLTKDLPVAEMEALLLANITVNDDAMRELALNRGVAVRDYLAAQNIAGQRLYLGATKLMAEADWKPQVELHLSTR